MPLLNRLLRIKAVSRRFFAMTLGLVARSTDSPSSHAKKTPLQRGLSHQFGPNSGGRLWWFTPV